MIEGERENYVTPTELSCVRKFIFETFLSPFEVVVMLYTHVNSRGELGHAQRL